MDVLIIVITCVLFGALMGFRDLLPSIWLRAAAAGLAFLVLPLGLWLRARRRRRPGSGDS